MHFCKFTADLRFVVVLSMAMPFAVAGCSRNTATTSSSDTRSDSGAQSIAGEPSADQDQAPAIPEAAVPEVSDRVHQTPKPKIVSESSPEPLELLDATSIALEDGDIDRAFDYARQAYRAAPEQPEVTFMMARLLGERRRFHESIAMLDRLLDNHPDMLLPVLGQTAEWMVQAGQWKTAETRYLRILKQIPSAAIVHRKLADLYARQGRRLEASEHVTALCRIGDVNEGELRSLLKTFCDLRNDSSDDSRDPIGQLGIARYELSQGKWDLAQASLESAKATLPEAGALLARVYATTNSPALPKHLESQSLLNHPDSWYARGINATKNDRHAEAIRFFAKCVLADKTDAEAYLAMSKSLETIGQSDIAEDVGSRGRLIQESQRLGSSPEAAFDQESIADLADTLDRLRRPLEAIAWRGVGLEYARADGRLPDSEIQTKMAELVRERSACLKSGAELPDETFLLCGVDLDQLPESSETSESNSPNTAPQRGAD